MLSDWIYAICLCKWGCSQWDFADKEQQRHGEPGISCHGQCHEGGEYFSPFTYDTVDCFRQAFQAFCCEAASLKTFDWCKQMDVGDHSRLIKDWFWSPHKPSWAVLSDIVHLSFVLWISETYFIPPMRYRSSSTDATNLNYSANIPRLAGPTKILTRLPVWET